MWKAIAIVAALAGCPALSHPALAQQDAPADACTKRGVPLEARLAGCTAAIKQKPDDPLAYIDRGNVYRAMDRFDRAAADYGEAIRVAPDDARGWRNRGMVRMMQGDFRAGIADYDKAIELDPKDAYSWNNRGIAKRQSGDKAGAVADFRKALEIDPSLSSTRKLLQRLDATAEPDAPRESPSPAHKAPPNPTGSPPA